MQTSYVKEIEEIAYHRNGICGAPFHIVKFVCTEGNQPMIGVVFDEPNHVAVFNRELLGKGVVAFCENSFRGDRFEAELRKAIQLD